MHVVCDAFKTGWLGCFLMGVDVTVNEGLARNHIGVCNDDEGRFCIFYPCISSGCLTFVFLNNGIQFK